MSYKVELELFHNCRAEGNKDTLDVPFLSKADNQWLSQGYYFWTDSVRFAEKWGKGKRYVYQFKYVVERGNLLDLVGSVSDQLKFIEDYIQTFKLLTTEIKELKKYQHANVPIGAIIKILREYDEFPYHAIKAYDKPKISKYYRYSNIGNQGAYIPTRQQIVIFKDFLDDNIKQSKKFLREVEV